MFPDGIREHGLNLMSDNGSQPTSTAFMKACGLMGTNMSLVEKIKIVLVKRKMSAAQLAEKLGYSSQNIYNKFGRNNFSEKELQEIAEALNCDFEGTFTLRDTGERV